MSYRLVLSENAVRALARLDKTNAKRVITKLKTVAQNPNRTLKRLSGRDDCKLRIGDYRAIVKVLDSEQTVFVIAVGHRRDVYEKN